VTEAIRQVVAGVRDPASWPRAATGEGSDRIAWQPCATAELPTRECGELVVPLSYREPQGATISLAVARVPAAEPGPADRLSPPQPGRARRPRDLLPAGAVRRAAGGGP
jgi:hypothetical protein